MTSKKSNKEKESYLTEGDISKIKEWSVSEEDKDQFFEDYEDESDEVKEIREMTVINPSILKEPYRI